MAQEMILETNTDNARNMARLLYLVHGATFVFSLGMLSVLPLIVNYIKRGETAGGIVHSHHSWMIRSFWFYVLWMVTGGILFATVIGIPFAILVWALAWIWKAYRLIRGFLDLENNKSMPI
jgi:uncharacterized membrane protein